MPKNRILSNALRQIIALTLCSALMTPEGWAWTSIVQIKTTTSYVGALSNPFQTQALSGMAVPFAQRLRDRLMRTAFFSSLFQLWMGFTWQTAGTETVPPMRFNPLPSLALSGNSSEVLSPQKIERLEIAVRDGSHGEPAVNDMATDMTAIISFVDYEENDKWLSHHGKQAMPDIDQRIEEFLKLLKPAKEKAHEINARGRTLTEKPFTDKQAREFMNMVIELPQDFEVAERSFRTFIEDLRSRIGPNLSLKDKDFFARAQGLEERLQLAKSKSISIWEQATGQPPRGTFRFSQLRDALKNKYGKYPDFHITWAQELESLDPEVQGNLLTHFSAFSNIIDNARHFSIKYRRKKAAVKLHFTFDSRNNLLSAKLQDNGPGIPARYLAHDIETGRIILYERRFSTRAEGTGWGTSQYYLAVQTAGGRADVHSEKQDRGSGRRGQFGTTFMTRSVCGPPVRLSPMRLPDFQASALGLAGFIQEQRLKTMQEDFYPPDVQNMIAVVQEILSHYSTAQLRRLARTLLQELGANDSQVRRGQGIRDVLANRCNILGEDPLRYIDELNDRRPEILSAYWRAVWTWEVLARLSRQHPLETDDTGSFYQWLVRPRATEIIQDVVDGQFFLELAKRWRLKEEFEIHSFFVNDNHGKSFTEEELEQAVFAWAIRNKRTLSLYTELFLRFSLRGNGLWDNLMIRIEGEGYGEKKRRKLDFVDRLVIATRKNFAPPTKRRGPTGLGGSLRSSLLAPFTAIMTLQAPVTANGQIFRSAA